MGTYKRLPRGRRKSQDEFKGLSLHVLLWLKNNWQTAIEVVGIAAVAFAIWIGASTYWQSRSESAADGLFAANRLQTGSEEQLSKLSETSSDYSRTPAGQQAMMELGNIYFDKKDYDKAIEEFKMLAGRSRNHPILMVAALHRLAEAELAKGDATKAAETYLKAASDPNNLMNSVSRFRAAECLEKSGDVERAAQLYKQIVSDAKDDDRMVRDASEERLIWLRTNNKISG